MRVSYAWIRPAARLAGLALSAVVAWSAPAAAEAPYFYDDLSMVALYDPDFDPMNRPSGTVGIYAQVWSQPTAGDPGESLADQDYEQQYRFQWNATLDARSSLLIELKGASQGMMAGDDYFLKTEYLFRGAQAPLWLYAGMRVPNETDALFYGGLESCSWRVSDVFRDLERDLPVAFKGYAELRYDLDIHDPMLRLAAVAHTIPGWGWSPLTLAAGIDGGLREGMAPVWTAQAHADLRLLRGFGSLTAVCGYGVNLEEDGEQRGSLGLRIGIF